MTPGVERQQEQNVEKQMGCMAGFFQLFDRHQILAGKPLYSAKRLPSSGTSSPSPSERSELSTPSFSKELGKVAGVEEEKRKTAVKVDANAGQARSTTTTTAPLTLFEFKEGAKSSWKLREAPRLSLDSRLLDRKGKLFPPEIRTSAAIPVPDAAEEQQRKSPSVVARLMGLDLLPKSNDSGGEVVDSNAPAAAELRRSASESRVTKDYLQYPFFQERNGNHTQDKKRDSKPDSKTKPKPSKPPLSPSPLPPSMPKTAGVGAQRRTSPFFNAQDFFPEPSKRGADNHHHQHGRAGILGNAGGCGTLAGEIEKRLRMRSIDDQANDLEKLRQILEALQLKGLLRSAPQHSSNQAASCRNLVFDQNHQSAIVLMKPTTTFAAPKARSRYETSPTPPRKTSINNSSLSSPRRTESMEKRVGRNDRISQDHTDAARSPCSPARRKACNFERRTSPAQSPRSGQSPRRRGVVDQQQQHPPIRSPQVRKQQKQPSMPSARGRLSDDSESNHGTCSQFDLERMKTGEYREGRTLLERCDKLLHSIAEITATEQHQRQQPSPVSVLDSAASFSDGGGGDVASPSPVLKRRIHFRDGAVWEESGVGPAQLLAPENEDEAGDRDFNYVKEIFGSTRTNVSCKAAGAAMPVDVYLSLEKWHQEEDPSKASRAHRRLVFDTVAEIVERRRQLSSWEGFSRSRSGLAVGEPWRAPARETWSELKRIREQVRTDDLCELVCGVLRKDMTREHLWWSDLSVEMSDAVLDIERLIFKDLVGETIRDLSTSFASVRKCRPATATTASRRKLLF